MVVQADPAVVPQDAPELGEEALLVEPVHARTARHRVERLVGERQPLGAREHERRAVRRPSGTQHPATRRCRPQPAHARPARSSTSRCRTQHRGLASAGRHRRWPVCVRANGDGETGGPGRTACRRLLPRTGSQESRNASFQVRIACARGRRGPRPRRGRRRTGERSSARRPGRRSRSPCSARRHGPPGPRATTGSARCAACTRRDRRRSRRRARAARAAPRPSARPGSGSRAEASPAVPGCASHELSVFGPRQGSETRAILAQ